MPSSGDVLADIAALLAELSTGAQSVVQSRHGLLQCKCPLLTQNGHPTARLGFSELAVTDVAASTLVH